MLILGVCIDFGDSQQKQHLLKTLVLNTLYVSILQMKQLQLQDG